MSWDYESCSWLSPDPLADRERDARDEYEATFDEPAMAMWDPNRGEWIDA